MYGVRNEQQVLLDLVLARAAEQRAEQRDVAEHGHLAVGPRDLVAHQAADDHGLLIAHHELGLARACGRSKRRRGRPIRSARRPTRSPAQISRRISLLSLMCGVIVTVVPTSWRGTAPPKPPRPPRPPSAREAGGWRPRLGLRGRQRAREVAEPAAAARPEVCSGTFWPTLISASTLSVAIRCGVDRMLASPEARHRVDRHAEAGQRQADELLRVGDRRAPARRRRGPERTSPLRGHALQTADRVRGAEAQHGDRVLGRHVRNAAVEREAEAVAAIDRQLHDHGLDEHLTALGIEHVDHVAQRRVVVHRRGDHERVAALVGGDRDLAFEHRVAACRPGRRSALAARRRRAAAADQRLQRARDLLGVGVLQVVHVDLAFALHRDVEVLEHLEDAQVRCARSRG